ncbi:serine hydrolase domain-containing protein [Jannaschia sp. CCS1]|uniref:serine hydrolase domain-containing protein n=1 Tax=Jannaschia sp. (strain CCS1) TaxID=290400 RepID=UPI001A90FD16|nr:serine hydrolase domain-containing protein [Jannaschia sp. CCS1]
MTVRLCVGMFGVLVGLAAPVSAQMSPQDVADGLSELASVPAATAGRVTEHDLEVAVAGTRVRDGADLVLVDDAWHVGSLTKSMTATLAARLVEAGLITWDTPVGEILGERIPDMDEAWRDTPLRAFLTHRSGMAANLPARSARQLGDGPRALYVTEMLAGPPDATVGEFSYSNAGYVIAGAMLEDVGDAPWEELMQTHVFTPLGMTSAGFGPPLGEAIEGHATRLFGGIRPVGQGFEADNIPAMGPAGRVHLSAEDMLIYMRTHLVRDAGFLSAESWDVLHAPVGEEAYAMGWGVGEDGSLVHSGSNTLWYAVAFLDPEAGEAAFVAVNSGDLEDVVEPVDTALRELLGAL